MSLRLIAALAAVPVAAAAMAAGYHGLVVDADGAPLPGAAVQWAGTNVGTVTDSVGRFSLHPVKGRSLLVARFVGGLNPTPWMWPMQTVT